MPNPLLTTEANTFMSVGELDLAVVGSLWPGFICREAEVFLNPKLVWKHMQSRDDAPLRLRVFRELGTFVPDVIARPQVIAHYPSVPSGYAGVNLVCPLEGFEDLGDHLVVCVRLIPQDEIRSGKRHYVTTMFPWNERRRCKYLEKNRHQVLVRHHVISSQGVLRVADKEPCCLT